MMDVLWEVLGWAGAAALLSAYALLSAGRLKPNRTYHLINVAGSVGLGLNAVVHHAWPGVTVNAVWLMIGSVTLIELSRHAGRRRPMAAQPPDNG